MYSATSCGEELVKCGKLPEAFLRRRTSTGKWPSTMLCGGLVTSYTSDAACGSVRQCAGCFQPQFGLLGRPQHRMGGFEPSKLVSTTHMIGKRLMLQLLGCCYPWTFNTQPCTVHA